uniref:Uncharacterized protein n=1 Tax=Timema shepardi TaxID=629360 RepID=A0A7R9G119_TIMSH|nr:unnamed protein product [Timema shepardi]
MRLSGPLGYVILYLVNNGITLRTTIPASKVNVPENCLQISQIPMMSLACLLEYRPEGCVILRQRGLFPPYTTAVLCVTFQHNQKCVRDRIGAAEVRDAYKYCLGLDRSGLQYLHFPEFCGDDLRVYRQAAQCASLTERDLEHRDTVSREEAAARRKMTYYHKLVVCRIPHGGTHCSRLALIVTGCQQKTKKVTEGDEEEEERSSDEEESQDSPDLSSHQRRWKRRGRKPKKRSMWSRYLKDKQLDDQEGEKAPDSQGDPAPDTDDPASPTPAQGAFLGFSDQLEPSTKERDPLYSPHWLSPNPRDFYMVTECMDTLNQLILTMCDDDVELLHRMNRIKSKSSRPTCEVRLAESLQKLANELAPFELQLITSCSILTMSTPVSPRPVDYVDPSEAIWLNQPEAQDCLAEDKVDAETGELLEEPLEDSLVSGEPMSLEETAPTPPADLAEGDVEGSDGVRVSHSRRAKRKRDIARTRVELQDGTEVPEAELSEDLRQELLGSNDDTDGNEEEDDDDPDDVWELPVKKRKVMPAKPRLPLIAGGPKKSRKKKKVPDAPNESDPSATPVKKCRKKKVAAKDAKSGEPGPVVPTKAVLNVDKEGRIVVPMTTTNPALLALQGKTIAEAMREGKVLKNHGSLVLRPAPPPQMVPPEDFRHSDITVKQEPVEVKEEPAPYPPTTIKLERPEDQNNRLAEEIKPSLNAIIKSGVYKHLPSGTNVIFKIFRREDGRIDLVPLNHELVDAGKIQDVPQLSQILTEYQDKVLSQSPDPGNPAPVDSGTFEPSALSDSLPVAPTPVEPQPVPRVKQEMQPIAILRTVKQEVGKMFDFPMEITSCSSTETTPSLTTQFPVQSLKTEAMFAHSQPHTEPSHPQVHLQVVNIERLTAQPSRPQTGLFLTDPRQAKVSKQAPVVYLSDDSSDSVEFVDSTPPTAKKPPQQPTITPVKQSALMPSITPVKQSLLMPRGGSPGQQTVLLSATGKQAMFVSGAKGNLASPNVTPRKIALIQGQNEVTPPRQRIVQASPLSTIQRTPGGTHGMQVAAKHRLNLGTPQKGVPSGQSISPRGAVPGRGGSAQMGVAGRGGSAQMGALGRGGSPQMGTLGRGGSPQIGALGRVGLSQTGSVIRQPAPVAAGAGQYGTGSPYSHGSPGGVMRGTGIKTYSRLPNPQGQPQSPANANMYTRSPASMSAPRGPFTQQLMNMQSGYESRMNGVPGQRMPSTRGRKPSLGPVTIINPNQGRGRGSPATAQTLLSTMLTSSDRGRGVTPSVNHNMLGPAGRGRGANPAPAQQTSAAQVVAHFSDSGLSYLLRLPSGSQIQLTQQQIEELRQKNGGMIPTMI